MDGQCGWSWRVFVTVLDTVADVLSVCQASSLEVGLNLSDSWTNRLVSSVGLDHKEGRKAMEIDSVLLCSPRMHWIGWSSLEALHTEVACPSLLHFSRHALLSSPSCFNPDWFVDSCLFFLLPQR